jgi:hypothetical protein
VSLHAVGESPKYAPQSRDIHRERRALLDLKLRPVRDLMHKKDTWFHLLWTSFSRAFVNNGHGAVSLCYVCIKLVPFDSNSTVRRRLNSDNLRTSLWSSPRAATDRATSAANSSGTVSKAEVWTLNCIRQLLPDRNSLDQFLVIAKFHGFLIYFSDS